MERVCEETGRIGYVRGGMQGPTTVATPGSVRVPVCQIGNNQCLNRGSPPKTVPLTRAFVVGLVLLQIPKRYATVRRDVTNKD